jgi:hypothetical protein
LPDGRTLLEYDDGSIAVSGLSNRLPQAARLGYLPRRNAPVAPPPLPTPVPIRERPADVADRLLDSLLDDQQRRDRRRFRRWWVEVDRGWLQMGVTPHDIRFRPRIEPHTEWSLCVVAADRALPPGDVWTTLLLTATSKPDTFFRVANWSRPQGPTPQPALSAASPGSNSWTVPGGARRH